MEAVLESAMKALAKKPQNGKLTSNWKKAIEGYWMLTLVICQKIQKTLSLLIRE